MKRAALFTLLAAATAVPVGAEVSVDRQPGGGVVFFFQPSDAGPWSRVRPEVPTIDILNAQGDFRPDSWPSWALDADGRPNVVWSSPGHDGEVFLAWNDGLHWRPPVNVSRRFGSDHGASVVLDEWGNRFVAWNNTRNNRSSIRFSGVSSDGLGLLGVSELSTRMDGASRPSLGVSEHGDIYVAYEEYSATLDQPPSVAIDRLVPPRRPDQTLHCSGENTADLSRSRLIRTNLTDVQLLTGPQVHSEEGHLWVTWLDSRDNVGWVELIEPGVFSAVQLEPFSPGTGIEPALASIREDVLAP